MRVDPATIPAPLLALRRALDAPLYLVGGAVRDLVRSGLTAAQLAEALPCAIRAADADLATPLRPTEVLERLSWPGYRVVPTGIEHGTVSVVRGPGGADLPFRIEITTFRVDRLCDGRHAEVEFADRLEDDLARRDFTFNALAVDLTDGEVLDRFGGIGDLAAGVVRAVGDPRRRFREDNLRLLRAVRFATLLEGTIAPATWAALVEDAPAIRTVSAERVRDELLALLGYPRPSFGFQLLLHSGLLAHVLPEVEAGVGVLQNRYHRDDVFQHSLCVVDAAPQNDPLLRLVALLHDVGKPFTRDVHPETGDFTFYRHEVVGADLTVEILRRLRFSSRDVEWAQALVRHHMFALGDPPAERTVRRWMGRVGDEHVDDLLRLREADAAAIRYDSSTDEVTQSLAPLREAVARIREAKDALSVRDLAVGGHDLIALGLAPGPIFSEILDRLLDLVLEQPEANQREILLALVRQWLAQGEIGAGGDAARAGDGPA